MIAMITVNDNCKWKGSNEHSETRGGRRETRWREEEREEEEEMEGRSVSALDRHAARSIALDML